MNTTTMTTIDAGKVHEALGRHILADGYDMVLDMELSSGRRLWDARKGRWYLDMFSFFATLPLGMNHPKLEDETFSLARGLANGPRVALRYMKRNMNAAETNSLKEHLDLEAWHHTRTGMTEDHREAARAFVEKREPIFKGH